MGKEEYIKLLTEQIRCEKARDAVANEVGSHIEDAARTYQEFGMSQDKAYEKAVKQMGDPVEVGVDMDRIHRPRFEWRIFALVILLSLFGLLVQYRIGLLADTQIFGEQCFYAFFGIVLMLAVYVMDYSILGKYPLPFYCGYVLVLAFTAGKMQEYGMMNVHGPQLVISMYLLVPLGAGILYHYRGSGYAGFLKCWGFFAAAILLGIRGAASVPMGINLTGIFLMMSVFAVIKGWFTVEKKRTVAVLIGTFTILPLVLLGVGIKFCFSDYQRARILALFTPGADSSYAMAQIRGLLAGCRLTGTATGEGFWVEAPLAHTSYVFTELLFGFGILAGAVVLALLAYMVVRIFHISLRQKNRLGMLLGMGCGLVFSLEIMEVTLMNLGIGLQRSGFLPFFSSGKLSALVFYVLMGLVLSIYRYKDIPRKEVTPRKKSRKIRTE